MISEHRNRYIGKAAVRDGDGVASIVGQLAFKLAIDRLFLIRIDDDGAAVGDRRLAVVGGFFCQQLDERRAAQHTIADVDMQMNERHAL